MRPMPEAAIIIAVVSAITVMVVAVVLIICAYREGTRTTDDDLDQAVERVLREKQRELDRVQNALREAERGNVRGALDELEGD